MLFFSLKFFGNHTLDVEGGMRLATSVMDYPLISAPTIFRNCPSSTVR